MNFNRTNITPRAANLAALGFEHDAPRRPWRGRTARSGRLGGAGAGASLTLPGRQSGEAGTPENAVLFGFLGKRPGRPR
jgi:hypothetical protein